MQLKRLNGGYQYFNFVFHNRATWATQQSPQAFLGCCIISVLCLHPVATCPKCNRCGQKKGWRQAKKNRRKGNSNALPGNSRQPATTSPHDISERKLRQSPLQHRRVAFHFNAALSPISPNWLNNNPISASYIPPTDTIHRVFFPRAFKKRIRGQRKAIATSPTLDPAFPVNYSFLTVKKWHHQHHFQSEVVGGEKHP